MNATVELLRQWNSKDKQKFNRVLLSGLKIILKSNEKRIKVPSSVLVNVFFLFVLLHITVLVLHRWYTGEGVGGSKEAVSFLFTDYLKKKKVDRNPISYFVV